MTPTAFDPNPSPQTHIQIRCSFDQETYRRIVEIKKAFILQTDQDAIRYILSMVLSPDETQVKTLAESLIKMLEKAKEMRHVVTSGKNLKK